MNLKEALDSGHPWRRKSRPKMWCTDIWTEDDHVVAGGAGEGVLYIYAEDIKADDYELKPIEITITDTQFWDAARDALRKEEARAGFVIMDQRRPQDWRMLATLAENLGLEVRK